MIKHSITLPDNRVLLRNSKAHTFTHAVVELTTYKGVQLKNWNVVNCCGSIELALKAKTRLENRIIDERHNGAYNGTLVKIVPVEVIG